MDNVLRDFINKGCFIYMDDIIIKKENLILMQMHLAK